MAIVLVTGGAGFIGSHLAEALLARGERVRVLDDFSTGAEQNLSGLDVELMRGDVREAAIVARAVAGAAVIYHCAAAISVPESLSDPRRTYDVNVLGTLALLEAARHAGAQRAVLASSCAVYGERSGPATEADPTQPASPYAESKLALEGLGRLYSGAMGLPAVSLRFFNVYGPRQSPQSEYAAVIPRFIEAWMRDRPPELFGDGSQTRDFVFVTDVVAAALRAADPAVPAGQTFNVGSGTSVTIRELAQRLHAFFPGAPPPTPRPVRPGDIRSSQADLSRSRTALGYRPQVDLQAGLTATVEWSRRRSIAVHS